jgi:hypothetical protein
VTHFYSGRQSQPRRQRANAKDQGGGEGAASGSGEVGSVKCGCAAASASALPSLAFFMPSSGLLGAAGVLLAVHACWALVASRLGGGAVWAVVWWSTPTPLHPCTLWRIVVEHPLSCGIPGRRGEGSWQQLPMSPSARVSRVPCVCVRVDRECEIGWQWTVDSGQWLLSLRFAFAVGYWPDCIAA